MTANTVVRTKSTQVLSAFSRSRKNVKYRVAIIKPKGKIGKSRSIMPLSPLSKVARA